MSASDNPQDNGQTGGVNLAVERILRSICVVATKSWSSMLHIVSFALNNSVHASAGFTLFHVNGLAYPRSPLALPLRCFGLGEGAC